MVQKAQTIRENLKYKKKRDFFLEGKHKNIPRQLNKLHHKDQFNLYHN